MKLTSTSLLKLIFVCYNYFYENQWSIFFSTCIVIAHNDRDLHFSDIFNIWWKKTIIILYTKFDCVNIGIDNQYMQSRLDFWVVFYKVIWVIKKKSYKPTMFRKGHIRHKQIIIMARGVSSIALCHNRFKLVLKCFIYNTTIQLHVFKYTCIHVYTCIIDYLIGYLLILWIHPDSEIFYKSSQRKFIEGHFPKIKKYQILIRKFHVSNIPYYK